MIYREIALPEALRRVALCAWTFALEPSDPPQIDHQVPPDGTTNLKIVHAPDGSLETRLVGPMLGALTVPVTRGFVYAGLRLRPEMARSLTGTAPRPGLVERLHANDRFAPIWRSLAALVEGRLDWSGVAALVARCPPGDPLIGEAVDRILESGGAVTIASLAAGSGLGERQFRRRFCDATGISPKQYAAVQRARRALVMALVDTDWAGIAHDSGFADQPHLVRDIKERYGAAPLRIAGYFGGMHHELLDGEHVRNIQAQAVRAA
jgi:AraC-like DNA-binding protein